MKSVLQRHTQSCVMVCEHVLQKFRTQGRIHVHTRKGAPSLPTRRSSLAGTLTSSSWCLLPRGVTSAGRTHMASQDFLPPSLVSCPFPSSTCP